MSIPFIYLDNNATTVVDPIVLDEMLPYFSHKYGNASGGYHLKGWEAAQAIETARSRVAALLGCESSEIIFTSGSTESLNLALKGVASAYSQKGNHIVTIATEHSAVLQTCESLAAAGMHITVLKTDPDGNINLEELENSITNKTIAVCTMLVNNETGVIHPVKKIADIVHHKGALLICDGTQGPGKTDVNVNAMGADVFCISSHKMYGPKGAGALFMRRKNPRVSLVSQINGGGQEKNLRSGTLNVPAIVGLGKACEIVSDFPFQEVTALRDYFEQALLQTGQVKVNGGLAQRAGNISNVQLPVSTKSLIARLPQIGFSLGSACGASKAKGSYVLQAMGLTEREISRSARFSFGKFNTKEEIEEAVRVLLKEIS
jgi:cysteine desulfurase